VPRHRATVRREPGGVLIRAGAVVFLLGFVAICLDVLPHPLSRQERPLPLNLLAFLTSLGLGMALWGLWRAIRAGMAAAIRADAPGGGQR